MDTWKTSPHGMMAVSSPTLAQINAFSEMRGGPRSNDTMNDVPTPTIGELAPRRLQKPDAPEINKFSTGRKHQLLAVDGYIYRWAQTGNECDLYYCQHYNVDSETHCHSALHYWSDGKITFLKERHMHVHGKEHEKIKAMEAKEKLMKLGEDNPLGRPRDLISQAITDSEAIAKLLPKKKSLEKLVQRSQLKKRFKIRCTSLEDIDIDAIKSCRTDNGQPILAFDTGFSHGVRAIGFSTPACLELFAKIEILSCDGTFKAKPRIFGKHGGHGFASDDIFSFIQQETSTNMIGNIPNTAAPFTPPPSTASPMLSSTSNFHDSLNLMSMNDPMPSASNGVYPFGIQGDISATLLSGTSDATSFDAMPSTSSNSAQRQPQKSSQELSIFERFRRAFNDVLIWPTKEDVEKNKRITMPAPGEPAFWATCFYYEFKERVGEPFKATNSEFTVDGYCSPSEANRFCLGALSNVHRNPVATNTRRQIGAGCRIYNKNDGNIYVECVSGSPIFIQSPIYAASTLDHLATVYRLPTGQSMQLFNKPCFDDLIDQAKKTGYQSVYTLQRMCHVRISFVKGWGERYRRQNITDCPCWIEVHLPRPLQQLDQILSTLSEPSEEIHSFT